METANRITKEEAIDNVKSTFFHWNLSPSVEAHETLAALAKTNDPEALCFYALSILKQCPIECHPLFMRFEAYTLLQANCMNAIEKAISFGFDEAIYWYAEVKCGMIPRFAHDFEAGKTLFEQYYAKTKDGRVKAEILDRFEEFKAERIAYYKEDLRSSVLRQMFQGTDGFSSHDEAFFDEPDDAT